MKKLLALLFLATTSFADQIAVEQFGYLNNNESSAIIAQNEAQDLLNVDVTPGGLSVKKRQGYGLYKTLTGSQAIHGGHHFFDSTGNDVQVWGSSTSLWGIVADGTPTQLISSGTLNATWDCADTQGFAYCVNSSRNLLTKTNGATQSWFTSPLGTMVAVTPERLLIAGVSGATNTLYFSEANNFTNFVTGVAVTSPFTEVIGSPGSRLTHVEYACGRILFWKDESFGYILGTDQTNLQIVTVSNVIGTVDNSSAIDPDGNVYFRAPDGHIYKYDCAGLEKLTTDITPYVQASGQRVSNSYTETTQAEFQTGTISPTASLSTTLNPNAIVPSTYSFTDTSSADFSSGTYSSTIDTFTVTGAVTLKAPIAETFASFASWTDDPSSPYYPNTMTVSGGAALCSPAGGGCKGKYTATITIPSDYLMQFTPNIIGGGDVSIGAINSSSQGYLIWATGSGAGYKLIAGTDFNDPNNPGTILCSSVTALSGSNTFRLHRHGSGNMDFYRNGTVICSTSSTVYTPDRIKVAINGSHTIDSAYLTASSGTFTSRVADTTFTAPIFSGIYFSTTNAATYSFGVRTSADNVTYSATSSVGSGSLITPARRYAVYTTTMSTTDPTALPQLHASSFTAISTGTYYTTVRNVPNLSSWDTITWSVTDNGGSVNFYMRSSTNSFTVLSSTPSWTAQTLGGVVSVATGTYFQVRSDFVADVSTDNPTLSDFTVNWFEGSAGDKAYATWYSDAIWWSVAFGDGVSTNNYIFKYDLLQPGWTLYNFGSGGFLRQNSRLYFGTTAATGKLYRFGDSTADEGVAINAYWKSKDFAGPDPWIENEFLNLDTLAMRNANQTLTASYTLNASTTATSFTINLSSSTNNIIRAKKVLPNGKIGGLINVKYGDTSATSLWELLGFRLNLNPLTYNPNQ